MSNTHWNTETLQLSNSSLHIHEVQKCQHFILVTVLDLEETSSCQTKASEHATCSSNIQLVQKAFQLGQRTPDEIATVSESLSG